MQHHNEKFLKGMYVRNKALIERLQEEQSEQDSNYGICM